MIAQLDWPNLGIPFRAGRSLGTPALEPEIVWNVRCHSAPKERLFREQVAAYSGWLADAAASMAFWFE